MAKKVNGADALVRIVAEYQGEKRLAYIGPLHLAAERCDLSEAEMMRRALAAGDVAQPKDSSWPRAQRYYAELAS
jgi:hypothetical protein